MSAVALPRPLLHHLHLPSHLQLAAFPFSRYRPVLRVGKAGHRLSTESWFWKVGGRHVRKNCVDELFGTGGRLVGEPEVRRPLLCENVVNSGRVAQRGSRKSSTIVVEEMKDVTGEKGKNRKRTSLEPKKLLLRPSVPHGNTFVSFVQVLGTGMDTGDTSACVLLFSTNAELFSTLERASNVFVLNTRSSYPRHATWPSFPVEGLLLTLSNTGDQGMAVNLWGPSNLNFLVDAMRTFIPHSSVVYAHSFGGKVKDIGRGDASQNLVVLLEDEVVKISAVLLHPVGPGIRGLNRSTSNHAMDMDLMIENQRAQSAPVTTVQTSEEEKLASEANLRLSPVCGQKRSRDEPQRTFTENDVEAKSGEESNRAGRSSLVEPDEVLDKPDQVAVVYVCELPEVIGKFDPEKASALGLKPGPKYGLLQSGKNVVSDDGTRTITPQDVMDSPSPGPVCLIVDCPTSAHFEALSTARSLEIFCSPGGAKDVTCMIHLGPACVTGTPEYQAWMTRFKEAQHVMAGHGMLQNVSPVLKSSARITSRLNYICPDVFPISGLLQNENFSDASQVTESSGCAKVITAENLLKYRLRPLSTSGIDRSGVPGPFNVMDVQKLLVSEIPELVDAASHLSDLWRQSRSPRSTTRNLRRKSRSPSPKRGSKRSDAEELPDCLKGVGREEMEMVFLGTGSSQPSKYRNVSAIYLHLFERGGLLLDCGEGTYAQLIRRYGTKAADEVVAGLKMVWVSHIHADHHTGLVRILAVRKQLLESRGNFDPILVIGPKQLKRYLDAYERLEDLGVMFVDCSQTTFEAESAASMSWNDSSENLEKQPLDSGGDSRGVGRKIPGLVKLPNNGNSSVGKGTLGGQLRSYWLQSGVNLQAGLDKLGREKVKDTLQLLGLEFLVSIPVVHCPHAFGVMMVSQKKHDDAAGIRPGWKLVYSGDTRPCRALVEASKGATVLIHEATFDDAMEEEALAKNHSMTKEAIETGITGGAYRTILTHFSQRYPKIPVYNESYNDRTCIAFDMMSANLADLPMLPKLLPALKMLFKDEVVAADEEGGDVFEQQ